MMWQYGEAGDRWPVQVGDVWEAGPHILGCGDLECGAAMEVLKLAPAPPSLVYSDPPWNAGNARSFRTKAGVGRPVDFVSLMGKVIEAAQASTGSVFLEMGKKHSDDLSKLVQAAGGVELARWGIVYYRKHPAVLLQFSWRGGAPADSSLEGMDDEITPLLAIEQCSKPGDLVFDPCTGRGGTCRAAHEAGRRFLGMELHPRRLAVTIDWLAKQGLQPRRAGSLTTMKAGA